MTVKNSTRNATAARLYKIILFGMLTSFASVGIAQSTSSANGSSQDCAEIILQALQELDNELLTQDEKIALLDEMLLRAINNFELCQRTTPASDPAANRDGVQETGATGETGETETAIGNVVVESTPASDIQGDDAFEETHQPVDDDRTFANQSAQDYRPATDPNGKLPEDIPSADGDDIIAQQFRQAAIEETDAKTKARLWNEYRRYKGLPEQAEPENE